MSTDLFGNLLGDNIERTATLSDCRRYRYLLRRNWNPALKPVVFIMLNPSVAAEVEDDPTIRRCMGFARAWGNGGILVVNLFALRATDPEELRGADDPVGPHNDSHLVAAVNLAHNAVAAWGVHGAYLGRDVAVMKLLRGVGVRCLGTTRDGHPRHPLYLAAETKLVPFRLEGNP